jgi:hypothetical protein
VIAVEKPGTPYELAHHGVKGMKWGVRKSQGTREFHSKFTTPEARAQEINRARLSVASARAKNTKTSNYDEATALRFTRGEKWVAAALHTLVPVPIVPLAVTGTVAYRVGKRRNIQD